MRPSSTTGRRSERWLWSAITASLAAVVLLLALSPRALALDDELEAQQLMSMFSDVFDFVRNNYVDEDQVDADALIQGALDGMFEALDDPYSAYIPAEQMGDLNDLTIGEFGGVGLFISAAEGGIEVVSPIEGQPAYRAGVQPGDVIVAIDGEPAVEFGINEVVSRLRGEPGSEVSITFRRNGAITFEVTVERELIEVPTVKFAMIPPDVGYLRISQFTRLTSERVADALATLGDQGYDSLVVDLRSNPGGLLSAVVRVSNYFLSSGTIVSTRSRVRSENHVYYASRRSTRVPSSVPIVVLIDRGSASASEILAAALQDTGRAYVIGERSYGKGSVQQVRHFGDNAVKVTTSRYVTPSGASIDSVGVTPDQVVAEPALSDEEKADLAALFESRAIRQFIRVNPQPSDAELATFITELLASYGLPAHYLRKLVHNEMNRLAPEPPVYDLEFDLVLQEALRLLDNGLIATPDTGRAARLPRADEPVMVEPAAR